MEKGNDKTDHTKGRKVECKLRQKGEQRDKRIRTRKLLSLIKTSSDMI